MFMKIFLIPNSISEQYDQLLSAAALGIEHLNVFFVEEIKSARRLLKKINPSMQIDECVFFALNEHTPLEETRKNFMKVVDQDIGVISESGCPCVADPGADVVLLAHQQGCEIIALVGPSSILLALMASGLSGQNFAFNGYLPKDRGERIRKIKDLEKRSTSEKQTQIFMEAPYRNQNVLEDILQNCQGSTLLCLAVDLTTPTQMIKTCTISEWKKQKIDINKKPALFLLYCES
ncbi:MAG: SAM-dependent methyltransferase [Candidatus Omnitrophica bacterium]|nr:SAM-dependent methyltransferase [Candidatus Omnitrophota bacterium]